MTYKINRQEGEFIRKWFPIFGVRFCREKLNKTTSQIEYYVLKNRIKANKDYKCNIYDYLNINTPEIIYSLGFLWADGSLVKASKNSYTITVTVTKKDEKYLKRIFKKWDRFKWKIYNKPASFCINKGLEIIGKPQTKFYLSDKYISHFLLENDYLIKSGASADKILSKIPEHLKHYWWRGYFDGDGCFYYNKINNRVQFSSVIKQDWSFLKKFCNDLNINYFIRENKSQIGKSSTFDIARKNDCIKFLDFIYQNREKDKIGYTRKYKKYKKANLQPVKKTSKYRGVCLDKSKSVNPWISYYKGEYIGCTATQEEAIKLRENYINYGNR